MEPNQSSLELLKGLDAMEILELIARAKTGSDEPAIKTVAASTLEETKEALEWFLQMLEKDG